jgi:hypothetical protein
VTEKGKEGHPVSPKRKGGRSGAHKVGSCSRTAATEEGEPVRVGRTMTTMVGIVVGRLDLHVDVYKGLGRPTGHVALR